MLTLSNRVTWGHSPTIAQLRKDNDPSFHIFRFVVQSWKNDDPVKDQSADQGRQDSGRAR